MKTWGFNKGLHDLGTGCYAWIQPDGTWGYSNSGLIADGGESLLVDTLYDLPKTQEMLDGYRKVVPAAQNIGTLVNTHSNGDHYFGNQLVHAPRIVASRACADDDGVCVHAALQQANQVSLRVARISAMRAAAAPSGRMPTH